MSSDLRNKLRLLVTSGVAFGKHAEEIKNALSSASDEDLESDDRVRKAVDRLASRYDSALEEAIACADIYSRFSRESVEDNLFLDIVGNKVKKAYSLIMPLVKSRNKKKAELDRGLVEEIVEAVGDVLVGLDNFCSDAESFVAEINEAFSQFKNIPPAEVDEDVRSVVTHRVYDYRRSLSLEELVDFCIITAFRLLKIREVLLKKRVKFEKVKVSCVSEVSWFLEYFNKLISIIGSKLEVVDLKLIGAEDLFGDETLEEIAYKSFSVVLGALADLKKKAGDFMVVVDEKSEDLALAKLNFEK